MKQLIGEYTKKIEAELCKLLPDKSCAQKTVCEAMHYSVEAGGKRLRPVMMLMFAEMLDFSENDVMPFACALEMIHTYSLIHDDLPAMDNDDFRRGKPTNHKVYGEAMAILAGDALLNQAAETVSGAEYSVPYVCVLAAVKELFTASGTLGMIGGQVLDIEGEGKQLSLSELQSIHLLKTGALIKAAGRIPCVLAGVSEEELAAVTEYCEKLGIAFQIQDDLLDVYGDSSELGKNTGSDAANGKVTYVTLLGRERSEELVKSYTREAVKSLDIFGEKAAELKKLAEWLTERRN